MYLEILTPGKKYYEGEVDLVKVTGSEELGSFEILKNHAPIISSLTTGKIKIKNQEGEQVFSIKSGFVEASDNRITILVEGVYNP